MSREPLLYLAYGSNLHPARLCARAPSARLRGTLALEGWDLRFNKRSIDGSAKANLVAREDGVAYAAVFAIDPAERAALDRAEGPGYRVRELKNPEFGRVFLYLARAHHVTDTLLPYRWYRDYVLLGARYHGFPPAYVDRIRQLPWARDRDAARNARHRAAIAAALGGDADTQ